MNMVRCQTRTILRIVTGRHVGSSIISKHESDLHRAKFHNNISIKYVLEKNLSRMDIYYQIVVWKKI